MKVFADKEKERAFSCVVQHLALNTFASLNKTQNFTAIEHFPGGGRNTCAKLFLSLWLTEALFGRSGLLCEDLSGVAFVIDAGKNCFCVC